MSQTIASPETIDQVIALRDQGLTHRQIASALALSKSYVQRILTGQCRVKSRRLVQPKRCATCGQLIAVMPCMLCEIRGVNE